MKKKTLHRSAKSGKLVTEEFASEHPATTVKETVSGISPLTIDFGRSDLNQLRDKLNELITRG